MTPIRQKAEAEVIKVRMIYEHDLINTKTLTELLTDLLEPLYRRIEELEYEEECPIHKVRMVWARTDNSVMLLCGKCIEDLQTKLDKAVVTLKKLALLWPAKELAEQTLKELEGK